MIVVAGHDGAQDMPEQTPPEITDDYIRQEVERRVAGGANKKDAIHMIASQWGLSRRRVYQLALDSG